VPSSFLITFDSFYHLPCFCSDLDLRSSFRARSLPAALMLDAFSTFFLSPFSLYRIPKANQSDPLSSEIPAFTYLLHPDRYLDYSPSSTNHLGSIHSCTPSPRRPALPVAIPPSPHLYHVPHRHPHCSAFSSFWTHFLRTRSLACYRCRYPILTYFIYPSLFFSVSDPPYSVLPMNIHKTHLIAFSTPTRTYALPPQL